jgi:hypothetical protein
MTKDSVVVSGYSEDTSPEADRGAERRKAERRRYGRYPLTLSVEAIESSSKTKISGRTSDIGLGGCYVDTICPLPVGASVKLSLTKDGTTFETEARVANASVGMGMGLKFIKTDPAHCELLEQWLAEVSGTPVSEMNMPAIEHESSGTPGNNVQEVALGELIAELMRLGILSETKGRAILRKLSGSAITS